MRFICFEFCLLFSELESVGLCLREMQNIDAILSSRSWKQLAELLWIHGGNAKRKNSQCSDDRFKFLLVINNHQFKSSCLGWSLVMVRLYFHLSFHTVKQNAEVHIECLEELALPRIEPVLCYTSRRFQSWLLEKFSTKQ